jgi:hypothetical protein
MSLLGAVNTSFGTAYEPNLTFNATAGTGSFNGSFVAPTIASVNGSVSYWILATSTTFLNNPQFSAMIGSVFCSANEVSCESYLLPGGLQSLSPDPPSSNLDPVVVVHNALASQVEFTMGPEENYLFAPSDCVVYGDDRYLVGLQMCLAPSLAINGSIVAGKSKMSKLEVKLEQNAEILCGQGSSSAEMARLMVNAGI